MTFDAERALFRGQVAGRTEKIEIISRGLTKEAFSAPSIFYVQPWHRRTSARYCAMPWPTTAVSHRLVAQIMVVIYGLLLHVCWN